MKPEQIRETLEVYYSFQKFRFMYKDYLDAICRLYEEKKRSNELSSNLLNPTPRNLREECVLVFQSRFSKKDLKILAPFFKINADSKGPEAIETVNLGKLKPLGKFLKNPRAKTSDRNIELLGWLLNFEPRPFVFAHNYSQIRMTPATGQAPADPGDDKILGSEEIPGLTDPNNKPEGVISVGHELNDSVSSRPEPFFRARKLIRNIYMWMLKRRLAFRVGGVAAACLVTAIYIDNKSAVPGKELSDSTGCMIWSRDHFEQIPCDSVVTKGVILPLDPDRLANQRKITRPDTLTKDDIENVWYRKRGKGRIEFYTGGAMDPVKPGDNLHPVTEYIFEKYVEKERSPDSISIRKIL